ncbi:hypothetical protein ABT336_02355 [Micromonospora sp. NPDC000207]|uniref:hypothetical protein n=1 Tax=Micromonospora sp. NPDC000207 TaxID=3154246 RepID=UPI00332F0E7D
MGLDRDQAQQRSERRDLIRLRRNLHLGEHDPGAHLVRRQQMQLPPAGQPSTADDLPVDGDE